MKHPVVVAVFAVGLLAGCDGVSTSTTATMTRTSMSPTVVVTAVKVTLTPAGNRKATPMMSPTEAIIYPNCDALNGTYKHGVGRPGAVDHVSGKTKPVTDFTVNATVYAANTARDGDKDGVACEKH